MPPSEESFQVIATTSPESWFSLFGQTLGKIVSTIGDFFQFLLYAISSIFTLLARITKYVFGGELFHYLDTEFSNLSIFLGDTTIYLIACFVLVLVLVVFKFILSLFRDHVSYKKYEKKL